MRRGWGASHRSCSASTLAQNAAGWERTRSLPLRGADGERASQASIHVRRSRYITCRLYDRLRVRNYDARALRFPSSSASGEAGAGMFEVRGLRLHDRGTLLEPHLDGRRLTLAYVGRDKSPPLPRSSSSTAIHRRPVGRAASRALHPPPRAA